MRIVNAILAYFRSIFEQEAKKLRAEVKKYESTILLVGVGSVWILIGRFVNVFFVEALGALILVYGILQVLK